MDSSFANNFLEKYKGICLIGQTGTGKTQLACELSEVIPCEIISVDSVMIYRDLNIGSSKPSPQDLKRYPHHLVDIFDIHERYSVAKFLEDVNSLIYDICLRGNIPLLVGGTMMYFYALQNGLSVKCESNADLENQANIIISKQGLNELYSQVIAREPHLQALLKENDTQRIIRQWQLLHLEENIESKNKFIKVQPFLWLANIPEYRQMLDHNLKQRTRDMFANGWVDEVHNLSKHYTNIPEMPTGVRSVGYKEIWQSLEAERKGIKVNWSHIENKIYISTRQLAKRQTTWLNKFSSYTKLDCFSKHKVDNALNLIKGLL